MKSKAIDIAKTASDKFLQPVIDATKGVHGSRITLAELLSKRLKRLVSRHRMTSWLNDDPEKREQPRLGTGIVLLEVFKENCVTICRPRKQRYWNRRPTRKGDKQTTKQKGKA